ncbi:MAG: hypothetical protein JW909_04300 [Planctomycetes bacterium]|nr:hypothetical protein [Planctomycetota bacterium]
MKVVNILGFVLSVIAVILACLALRQVQKAADKPVAESEEAKQIAALSGKMGSVEAAQKKAAADMGKIGADVMSAKIGQERDAENIENLQDEVAVLQEQLESVKAEAAQAPAVAPPVQDPAPGAVTEARVRELMREEMRSMFDRTRGGQGGRRGGDQQTELRQNVGLDEATAQQVAGILERSSDAIRTLWRENQGGDREAIAEQMTAIQQKADAEVAELLGPDELEKYTQWRQERNNRGRRDRRPPGGPDANNNVNDGGDDGGGGAAAPGF